MTDFMEMAENLAILEFLKSSGLSYTEIVEAVYLYKNRAELLDKFEREKNSVMAKAMLYHFGIDNEKT